MSASVATGLRRASATALPASPLQRRLQRGGAITKALEAAAPSPGAIEPGSREEAARVCAELLQLSRDELHVLQARYGRDVGEMWARCGRDVGEM